MERRSLDRVPSVDIWKRDYDVCSGCDETADIYRFLSERDAESSAMKLTLDKVKSIIENEGEDNPLASLQSDAHYVHIEARSNGGDFVLAESALHAKAGGPSAEIFDGLVPVAFLIAFAEDVVDWQNIEEWKKRTDKRARAQAEHQPSDMTQAIYKDQQQTASTAPVSRKITERHFIQNWRHFWSELDVTTFTRSTEECWIPTRDFDGRLGFRTFGSIGSHQAYARLNVAVEFRNDWRNLLEETWQKRTLPTQSQPPRWARVPLKDGLKIVYNKDHINKYHKELSDDFLKKCADKVIEEREKDTNLLNKQLEKTNATLNKGGHDNSTKSNLVRIANILKKKITDNKGWNIHVDDKTPVPKQNSQLCTGEDGKNWYKLSSNPFDLYDSYVSEKDWNLYMNSLAADTTFEAEQVPRPHCPPLGFLTNPSQEVVAVQDAYKAFLTATRTPKSANKEARVNYGEQLAGNLKLKSWHKHSHVTDLGSESIFKQCARGVRFQSSLNYRKIEVAAGERDTEYDQKVIMGNQSASKVAYSLGWKHNNDQTFINLYHRHDNQLESGFYTAEWLHLRAYSWGGHLDLEEYQGVTSQNPLNLVLGTSEANSLMVRYEKAWQNLFIFEHELNSLLEGHNPPTGQLWIRTNCPTATDPDTSEILENQASGSWDSLDVVEKEQCQTNSKNTTTQPGQFARTSVTIDNNMHKLTAEYPWIAHSIAYRLSMDTHSYVLNRPGATKGIRFYPFGRPFYHRAESLLDSILFAELKNLARSRAAKTLGDSQLDKQKKEKIFGKRKMPPDGNSGTKGSGANQSGNLPPGGSTKNQNKSGNDRLNKDSDDMAEYGNPETTYTMPIAMDDYTTGSGAQKATNYKPVYGSKPKPRDTTGNDNTTTGLDRGESKLRRKKLNVELRSIRNAELERQQSYSVLKWNYEALRANAKSSKSQEVKPKLPDGKRAPPSEMGKNRFIRRLEVHPDYIPNDGITMSMAAVTVQQQREMQDSYKSQISGFAAGRQNFLDDSVKVIQTHQKNACTSQNESQGGGSEGNHGNYPFKLSGNNGLNDMINEEFE